MFGPLNFFIRWLFTIFIVFATYNPTGVSYYHWITSGEAPFTMLATTGVFLLGVYAFLIRATWRSMKGVGITLCVAFFTFLNFILVDLGVVQVTANWVITVMALITIASTLSIGVSFSAVRARIAGQIDSDDVGT